MIQETWAKHWGVDYRRDLREMEVRGVLRDLESEKRLGDTIIDFGSGIYPVSQYLTAKHKVVTVDIEGTEGETEGRFHIRHDVEMLTNEGAFSTRKAFIKMARNLEIDIRGEEKNKVDTMIFSHLLNYVDFRLVLSAGLPYLKPNGVFIIINQPGFGYSDFFSERGVKQNSELFEFLSEQKLDLIKKIYPWNKNECKPDEKSMLIAVAQKSNGLVTVKPNLSEGEKPFPLKNLFRHFQFNKEK